MAYTGTLCSEAEINAFAGELVDSTGNTEANHNYWTKNAESFLICLSKYNWIDNFASINTDVKGILAEYTARYAAVCAISYNMAGYTSRIEAEDMINVHMARMKQIEMVLCDKDYINWIKAGATP